MAISRVDPRTLAPLLAILLWGVDAGAQTIITVQPQATGLLCPTHIGWGDLDFYGNGPEVEASATLFVDRDQRRLMARLTMWAQETRPDYTTAQGTADFVVWTAPEGQTLLDVVSTRSDWLSYTDTGHERDFLPGRGPVRVYQLTGDTDGDDLGGRCTNAGTSVQVLFNPVQLRVRDEPAGCPVRLVQATLRNPGRLCPSRIETGDGDFFGNGPQVSVTARLYPSADARSLAMDLSWTASENPWYGERIRYNWFGRVYTPPSTTVSAHHGGLPVWTAPVGCRIHEIRTGTRATGGQIDDDYAVNRVLAAPGGTFVHSFEIIGDTDGEDVPVNPSACNPAEQHSVGVNFYPVTVLVGP